MLHMTLLMFQYNRVTKKKSYSKRTASVEKRKNNKICDNQKQELENGGQTFR